MAESLMIPQLHLLQASAVCIMLKLWFLWFCHAGALLSAIGLKSRACCTDHLSSEGQKYGTLAPALKEIFSLKRLLHVGT